MTSRFTISAAVIAATVFVAPNATAQVRGRLQVAPSHRYLQHQDGAPFFYLADTAWELFHRLNREEATLYLEDRARKGFTVIPTLRPPAGVARTGCCFLKPSSRRP